MEALPKHSLKSEEEALTDYRFNAAPSGFKTKARTSVTMRVKPEKP